MLFYVYEYFCMYICRCICVYNACKSQKKELYALELKLEVFVSRHVGNGNRTKDLCKYSLPLSNLPGHKGLDFLFALVYFCFLI